MRFLVDAQLPPALARWLTAQGHPSEHVDDRGLASAADIAIWSCATTMKAVVISKDEDFALLRARRSDGPAVVWIRKGNVSRVQLLAWFEPLLPSIIATLERGEVLVEVL